MVTQERRMVKTNAHLILNDASECLEHFHGASGDAGTDNVLAESDRAGRFGCAGPPARVPFFVFSSKKVAATPILQK
jgi:hypothetical protein